MSHEINYDPISVYLHTHGNGYLVIHGNISMWLASEHYQTHWPRIWIFFFINPAIRHYYVVCNYLTLLYISGLSSSSSTDKISPGMYVCMKSILDPKSLSDLWVNWCQDWDTLTPDHTFSWLFTGYTVEVWEWISNFIQHFMMDRITYPCWD